MKLNNQYFPITSALLLVAAATPGAIANPNQSPAPFSADSSTLNISLNDSGAAPLWSYPFAFMPQGAIAQIRPVKQDARIQATSWAPLVIKPGDVDKTALTVATPPTISPLASLLPAEHAQSAIAISKKVGVANIKRVKARPQPEASVPAVTNTAVSKAVVTSKPTASSAPVRIAVRPTDVPAARVVTPAIPATVVVKTPSIPIKAVATPSPLSSRHKDLTLLAQMEADLNRSDRRLKTAEAKLSEGQRQLSKCADTLRVAMMEAGPDARGLHPFVKVAQRYAGTPYVWGGESARGFDCSGFIILVMRDLGYKSLPHSAAEQFNYGKPIARELMKPGDLVFFKNTYKAGISHVGIYLGNGRFIHAAGTGKGTIVSTLFEAKWRPGGAHYAGARRLIAARG